MAGHKRKAEEPPPAEEEEIEASSLTPLQREILHGEQEQKGALTFPIVRNDGTEKSLVSLIQLKAIFCQQLPKMPKEYISRLVLDRQHVSLACAMHGEIVGGITYRPVASQALSEIVFCAVSLKHQVQGYGTRIMNQIKEECKRTGIEGMLTYADNHAVGYFRKQGFKKNVTMKRERWQGYLKDYEGATLMECLVDPTIDYLTTRQIADQQRRAVAKRLAQLSGGDADAAASSAGLDAKAREQAETRHAHLLKHGWPAPVLEVRVQGQLVPTQRYLSDLLDAVRTHEDAWPFREAVSVADAPDYYAVIKTPVDLAMVTRRLAREPPYYVTPDQLCSDLYQMCENCRVYNDPSTSYWECAQRLENFVRAKAAQTTVTRKSAASSKEASS